MIAYRLPKTVNVGGLEYPINKDGDYRMLLDVMCVFEDFELTNEEKQFGALNIFYGFDVPTLLDDAILQMNNFINCGLSEYSQDTGQQFDDIGRLMSWEKDFVIICDDINAKYGVDIRGIEYLHWWTFMSYYKCLGEGQFNTIVGIRKKLKKNAALEKWEQEYYQANKTKVNLGHDTSVLNAEEEEFLDYILGG